MNKKLIDHMLEQVGTNTDELYWKHPLSPKHKQVVADEESMMIQSLQLKLLQVRRKHFPN